MKVFQKVLKLSASVLFWCTILLLVFVTVITFCARIAENSRISPGGIGFGRVVTGSMEPDIPVGSFILIQNVDPVSIQVGDVITFYSDDPSVPEGTPVSHKVMNIEEEANGRLRFTTKGTANDIEDPYPVFAEDIIGKVIFSSHWIGKVIGLTQSPYVYPILIALLGVSLIQSIVDVVRQLFVLSKEDKR